MEKILQDRLNHLKSDLADYEQPKMGKYMPRYATLIDEAKIRINEIEIIIDKINKTK